MSRWVIALCAAVLALAHSAPAQDPDAIKARLDKARTAYETELAAADKGVADALDKAEAAARRAGDKKAVDKLKVEREWFELAGVLPKSVPAGATQKVTAARKTLDAALASAVKDYIKVGQDTASAAAEKERAALKDAPVLRPRYLLLVNKKSEQVLAVNEKAVRGSYAIPADRTGADTQLWLLVPTDTPGAFLLRNKASAYYPGVRNSTTMTIVSLWEDTGDGGRWVVERDGAHVLFRNVHSGLYLVPKEKEPRNDTPQALQRKKTDGDDDSFRWSLVPAKPK